MWILLSFIFSSGLWWQSHRCEWNLLESSLPESPIQHIVRVRLEYRGLTSLTQCVSTHLFCDSWRHLIRASWQAPARRTIRITWRELSFSRGNGTCDNNGLTITDVTDDGQSHQVQFCGLVRTTTPFLCSEFLFYTAFYSCVAGRPIVGTSAGSGSSCTGRDEVWRTTLGSWLPSRLYSCLTQTLFTRLHCLLLQWNFNFLAFPALLFLLIQSCIISRLRGNIHLSFFAPLKAFPDPGPITFICDVTWFHWLSRLLSSAQDAADVLVILLTWKK